jgi:hypothetical protein
MSKRADAGVYAALLAHVPGSREHDLPTGMSDLTGSQAELNLALLTAALLADEHDRPAAIVVCGLRSARAEQDYGAHYSSGRADAQHGLAPRSRGS